MVPIYYVIWLLHEECHCFILLRIGNIKLLITVRTNSKAGNILENLIVILGYGYIIYRFTNIISYKVKYNGGIDV